MGTQNILMLVVGFVIIALAIYTGIKILNGFNKNQVYHAIISDLTNFRALAHTYYRTSKSLGGSSMGSYDWTAEDVAGYIGVGYDGAHGLETSSCTVDVSLTGTNNEEIAFLAESKDNVLDYKIKMIYNVRTGDVSITKVP